MNLLFVHDHNLRKENGNYYSTGTISKEILERYLKENDKIFVYTREKEKNNESASKLIKVNSDNIICVPSKQYKKPIDYYKNKSKIREEILERLRNIDFCIIRLPSILGSIVYEEVRKRNIPYVVEMVACTWDAFWNYGNIQGKFYAPINYIRTRKQIKKAKNVVYVSEKFLQKRYPTNGKSIACSNVNIEKIEDETLEKRINKIQNMQKGETIKLGLIGSLNVHYKGHETAIKALANLKNKMNVEIHFLGSGNKEQWVKLAKKYGVLENIVFDGTLPGGKPVYDWLDKLDIFLIPSLQEGLPRALIEAMSRGCPAIGVKTGGIPELLDKEYVCKRKDYKTIAKKIIQLSNNKECMIEQSSRNFKESKKYIKRILNTRRRAFFDMIYQENNLK